jgi:hypothetical protein
MTKTAMVDKSSDICRTQLGRGFFVGVHYCGA